MKKILSICTLTLASLGLASFRGANQVLEASDSAVAPSTQEMIISALRDLVTVDATATTVTTYDDPNCSYLDSTVTNNIRRDYGYIVEEDGSHTPAVRFIDGASSTTYYQGDDGYAYYDTLTADNEVVTNVVNSMGLPVTYDSDFTFINPWNFISADDIADDLSLDVHKASFLLQAYFGLERGIVSAKLVLNDDGLVDSIELSIADLFIGYPNSVGEIGTATASTTATIHYTYGETDLRHLTPSTASNPELDTAIANLGNNYTMTLTSSMLASPCTFYVTEDYVFIHNVGNQLSIGNQDMVLEYDADNDYYFMYEYNLTSQSWGRPQIVTSSNFKRLLPSIFSEGISTSLFNEVSDGVYALADDAAGLGATALMMPVIQGLDGTGLAGYVKVEDEHITSLSATFSYYTSNITFVTSITDYGTTEIPSYVDLSAL